MEDIAPPLQLGQFVVGQIESGTSVRQAINDYIRMFPGDFSNKLAQWLIQTDHNLDTSAIKKQLGSPYRQALVGLIERGLKGEGILVNLRELNEEIRESCEEEIEIYLKKLPFIVMVPLLLLMFPSLIILTLGPFLAQFLSAF